MTLILPSHIGLPNATLKVGKSYGILRSTGNSFAQGSWYDSANKKMYTFYGSSGFPGFDVVAVQASANMQMIYQALTVQSWSGFGTAGACSWYLIGKAGSNYYAVSQTSGSATPVAGDIFWFTFSETTGTATYVSKVTPPVIAGKTPSLVSMDNADKILVVYKDDTTNRLDDSRVYSIAGTTWSTPATTPFGVSASFTSSTFNTNYVGNQYISSVQNGYCFLSITSIGKILKYQFSTGTWTVFSSAIGYDRISVDAVLPDIMFIEQTTIANAYLLFNNAGTATYHYTGSATLTSTVNLATLFVGCKMISLTDGFFMAANYATGGSYYNNFNHPTYYKASGAGSLFKAIYPYVPTYFGGSGATAIGASLMNTAEVYLFYIENYTTALAAGNNKLNVIDIGSMTVDSYLKIPFTAGMLAFIPTQCYSAYLYDRPYLLATE